VAEKYEKGFITGDFNFPELTWNCDLTSQNVSPSSTEFRDLAYDFFLEQVNPYPTRLNNILDLILTNSPECVIDVSCISPQSMDLFSDHNLLFFDFNLFAKLSSSDKRSVLDYRLADWPRLYRTLLTINLSPSIALNRINNMSTNSNPDDSTRTGNVGVIVSWMLYIVISRLKLLKNEHLPLG
jgi:hypothetical protein